MGEGHSVEKVEPSSPNENTRRRRRRRRKPFQQTTSSSFSPPIPLFLSAHKSLKTPFGVLSLSQCTHHPFSPPFFGCVSAFSPPTSHSVTPFMTYLPPNCARVALPRFRRMRPQASFLTTKKEEEGRERDPLPFHPHPPTSLIRPR